MVKDLLKKIKTSMRIFKTKIEEVEEKSDEWVNYSLYPKNITYFNKKLFRSFIKTDFLPIIDKDIFFEIDSDYKNLDDENGRFSLNQFVLHMSKKENKLAYVKLSNLNKPHSVFNDADSLLNFIHNLQKTTDKPVGIMLEVAPIEYNQLLRGMINRNIKPDFIFIDSSRVELFTQIDYINKSFLNTNLDIKIVNKVNDKFDMLKSFALGTGIVKIDKDNYNEYLTYLMDNLTKCGVGEIRDFNSNHISINYENKIKTLKEFYQ